MSLRRRRHSTSSNSDQEPVHKALKKRTHSIEHLETFLRHARSASEDDQQDVFDGIDAAFSDSYSESDNGPDLSGSQADNRASAITIKQRPVVQKPSKMARSERQVNEMDVDGQSRNRVTKSPQANKPPSSSGKSLRGSSPKVNSPGQKKSPPNSSNNTSKNTTHNAGNPRPIIANPSLVPIQPRPVGTHSQTRRLIVVLEQACLEAYRVSGGGGSGKDKKGGEAKYALLNCDDHQGILAKTGRDIADARPDITHQVSHTQSI